MKKNLILLFFILAGVIFGGLLAQLCSGVPFLQWMAYGKTIGIDPNSPFILDLSVLKIAFGFSFGINVAQVICILLAILCYKAVGKKL